MLQKMNQ